MELHILLCFSNIIYLSSLVIFIFFLFSWLALHSTLLVPSVTTIIFFLVLISLVLLSADNVELLQLAMAREDRLKLCSTVRGRCPSGCHHRSQPLFLCYPDCNCSVELKEHVSSYICCACFFKMVTAGYVTMVLLSCLIYPVLVPKWSIITAMICIIMMTLLATVYFSLIEPCVLQAQNITRCQAAAMAESWKDRKEPKAEPEVMADSEGVEE
ncbi:uncharacterized protein LOC127387792 [Apus apus]|uniref:uncharacterized protein LOC127387792 n=1 Tax=Apus apus TaxID=8895 RepID=UPI0021F82CF3|nr:uncharacterized protein LOC127387792 [Apus apus]